VKNRALAERLLRLRDRDLATRARLAAAGDLFDGYAPAMEAMHVENAETLTAIVEESGWPRVSEVGEEASEAAWLVAQHAISRPDAMRAFRVALEAAVRLGEAPARHLAYLTDRIRFHERRPQVYGTIHDWDESGELGPWTIERPERVDELRRSVGLPPLAETTARLREEARAEGERPASTAARRERASEWARRVGWVRPDT
jgi:hypothetical protein